MPHTSRELPTAFDLARRLRARTPTIAGWVGFADPIFVEAVARSAVQTVVLDMQHGLHDATSAVHAVAAVASAGKPAIVRVPVDDFAMASRALDFGAAGVIAPMINSADDARRFASFMKYPPRGTRSWGPGRAMTYSGVTGALDHLSEANGFTLALAMIETREALAAIDEILAVDGIDGVFVGPNDLCIALTDGAAVDPESPLIEPALRAIVAAAHRAGKIAGIFGGSGARAAVVRDLGYELVTIGHDIVYVQSGIAAMLEAMDA